MGQDLKTDAELVARATRRCLEVADELEARSLALPAFGTGVGGCRVSAPGSWLPRRGRSSRGLSGESCSRSSVPKRSRRSPIAVEATRMV